MIGIYKKNVPGEIKCQFNAKTATIQLTVGSNLYNMLKYTDSLHAYILSRSTHIHLFIEHEWGMLVLGICKNCASVLDLAIDVPLVISNILTGEKKRITVYLRK
ncbi:MAG: hypothetical protein ACE5KA_06590 [Nitrososphaerales archaeon]